MAPKKRISPSNSKGKGKQTLESSKGKGKQPLESSKGKGKQTLESSKGKGKQTLESPEKEETRYNLRRRRNLTINDAADVVSDVEDSTFTLGSESEFDYSTSVKKKRKTKSNKEAQPPLPILELSATRLSPRRPPPNYLAELPGEGAAIQIRDLEYSNEYPFKDLRGYSETQIFSVVHEYCKGVNSQKLQMFNFTQYSPQYLRDRFSSSNLKIEPVFFFSHWVANPKTVATDFVQCNTSSSCLTSIWRPKSTETFNDLIGTTMYGRESIYDLYNYDYMTPGVGERYGKYSLVEYYLPQWFYPRINHSEMKKSNWAIFKLFARDKAHTDFTRTKARAVSDLKWQPPHV